MFQTLRSQQLSSTGIGVTATSPLPHCAVGRDGLTCRQRLHGRPFNSEIPNLLVVCSYWKSQTSGGAYAMLDYLWCTDQTGEHITRTLDGVTTARGLKRISQRDQFPAQTMRDFVGLPWNTKVTLELSTSTGLQLVVSQRRMYITTKALLDEGCLHAWSRAWFTASFFLFHTC